MDKSDDIHVARLNTADPAIKKEALEFLRRPEGIKVSRWRWETMNGRVLAHGVAGRIVMLYRDVCREELGEDV